MYTTLELRCEPGTDVWVEHLPGGSVVNGCVELHHIAVLHLSLTDFHGLGPLVHSNSLLLIGDLSAGSSVRRGLEHDLQNLAWFYFHCFSVLESYDLYQMVLLHWLWSYGLNWIVLNQLQCFSNGARGFLISSEITHITQIASEIRLEIVYICAFLGIHNFLYFCVESNSHFPQTIRVVEQWSICLPFICNKQRMWYIYMLFPVENCSLIVLILPDSR